MSERRQPLYKSLIAVMRQRIESGQLPPGSKAPSESDLIAEFRVSATTARRCLDELKRNRMVRRIQGKGTFVTPTSTLSALRQVGVLYNELFNLTEITCSHFLHGIGKVLDATQRHPMLIAAGTLRSSGSAAAALREIVQRNRLEGLLVMSPLPLSWLSEVLDDGMPVASVNFVYDDPRIPAAVTDADSVVSRLDERLRQHGHQRVVVVRRTFPQEFLEGVQLTPWNLPAGQGVQWALETYPYFGPDLSQQVVDKRLAEKLRPTAFVALGYELALLVRHAIKARGLLIPADVSLLFAGAVPGPSEIDGELMHMQDIGEWAARAVLDIAAGRPPEQRVESFASQSLTGVTLAQAARR